MVYTPEFLNTLSENQDILFNVQSAAAGAITVYFNNKKLPPSGPTPLVDISTSSETTSAGIPESLTKRITLTGKIVRPQADQPTGSGISHVLSGIKEINNIVNSGNIAKLEIKCGTTNPATIYEEDHCKIISVDFTKTSDNWVQTADYTIVLEATTGLLTGFRVKNVSDSWSIESLEDYAHSQFSITDIRQKQEYHNPYLKPTAASPGAPQPPAGQSGGGGGAGASPSSQGKFEVFNIPQYRISRTVSAIGLPMITGIAPSGAFNAPWQFAKAWVDHRLDLASQGTPTSGVISFFGKDGGHTTGSVPPGAPFGYLYNHMRSTNIGYAEGKYEVVDNWIAMPTGIGYIEDYTIEMSTDDRYIHTISVKGEIRGLSLYAQSEISGIQNQIDASTQNSRIRLHPTGTIGRELAGQNRTIDGGSLSYSSNITKDKYLNANSGWIYDIKPYLYRRACAVMGSKDRLVGYVAGTATNGVQGPLNNPVYAQHTLLNVIPISTSESHNTKKGTISYSYEFNNKFTILSGVISENITMEDTGPADVIGEAFVLGRALGPVLQNLGTKTSSRRSITLEVAVVPPSSLKGFFINNSDCPLWTGGILYQSISGIIEGLKPFGDRPPHIFGTSVIGRAPVVNGQVYVTQDNYSWDPTNGRYVRSVGWVYQQCTNAKAWFDT